MTKTAAPKKTREIYNNHMNSAIWNDFRYRDDDIIIATYAKSGTTWMQQIVSQLIFQGEEGRDVAELSPWLDLRLPPPEVKLPAVEAQTHRRFIKTHLPLDAFVFDPRAKHIYIGRDGRDVMWSMHNHHMNMTDEVIAALNGAGHYDGPPLTRPVSDPCAYFRDWLDGEGFPVWSFWENIRTWWQARDLPNVMFVHFNDLKADMPGEIARIAEFLEIDVGEETWPAILEHCSFDYMKNHAEKIVPLGGEPWKGGAKTFINKGSNGRWRDMLPAGDSARYEARALEELGEDCAHWLQYGKASQDFAAA
ncbi:sulfotransferase domain-containing protein [Hyphococcus sp.]|uniref:sulfotransferase domain-containing protein n=1 Tax=Hyphococcus sp. TaxID=2038636 RepID=UPI003CCBF213